MPEQNPDHRLEIVHVLFIDMVGWSKLLITEQSHLLQQLNEIVRKTMQVRSAEASGKLVRLPTGDGMALAFFTTPDSPLRCAIEITRALKAHPNLSLRMGINSGPVDEIIDVNERSNIAGAGITIAQRVMDCGDAGHILLSKRSAEDLAQYANWQPHLHPLGECEVKHGQKIEVFNYYTDDLGNSAIPEGLLKDALSKVRRQRTFIAAGLLLLALAAILIGFEYFRRPVQTATSAPTSFAQRRIAVLPFRPLLPENRDQVLELGMADTFIAKLSNSRAIIVSSLNAVRKFGGLDQDAVAAGRALQVNSVLDGNVPRVGDRIRVTARLINVADGSSRWAATFDEKFTDVFAVQDAISEKVADALALRLTGEEKSRLTKRYTDNLEAYQFYLTGRYHYARLIPSEIRTAMTFYQRAINLDPNYALVYFGLAEANRSLAITSDVPSKDCLPQAKAAAMKALQIDDALAEAHPSLSFIVTWFDWDWGTGEREARRAVVLNANSAMAHFSLAHILSDQGRHDEAVVEGARAVELDPVFFLFSAIKGMFLHHAGRNDEANAQLQKAIALDPNFWIAHLTLGKVYTQQRKYPEAMAEFTKAKELSHGNSEAIGSMGYVAALSGDEAKARGVLEELKTISDQHYVPPVPIALVYNGLGKQEEALSLLEKALQERGVRLTLPEVHPKWDSFRSNPRFLAVLKQINLQ